MLTAGDNEFQRRLEKKLEEEFKDRLEKMAFRDPKEKIEERRGELRMIRHIGELCKDVEREMRTS